ncbi:MAG: hypothetical protein ABI539_08365 [Acidobacteriota bacterium]
MPKFQPKTHAQIKRIFGLAKPLGCSQEDLRELAADVTGGRVERLSLLSYDEANAMIHRLGGEPLLTSRTPRRTVNYHRQQAGVQQIAQHGHTKLMHDLAAGRGISPEGLQNLCRRMLRGSSHPRTTAETNTIIEALKAMNARDARKAKEAA